MEKAETLEDFYKRIPIRRAESGTVHATSHFNVYSRDNCRRYSPYNRRDFYKISLIIGTGTLYYADKGIAIDRPALLFSNPVIPYSWEALSEQQDGFFCLFTEGFLQKQNESLQESPLFRVGGNPVFFLNDTQVTLLSQFFQKMLEEIDSEYIHKYDLLRHYVHLIIHEAMKMQPAESYFKHGTAALRISALFTELLERQFPIDSPQRVLKLKTATDFAANLSVHVNHLNRAVKNVTGKTTTEHIANRLTQEAKALLRHTDWNIAEIGYALGFEYPSNFNTFFRKQTRLTPKAFRLQLFD